MLDFLNETTYDNDLQQQDDIASMFETPLGAGNTDADPDLIEILQQDSEEDTEEAETPEQEQTPSTPDDDLGAGIGDDVDMSFLNSLFSEREQEDEGSSYTNARNTLSKDDSYDSLNWLNKKSSIVNLKGINPSISKYLNTLPEDIRKDLVATSGDDQEHAPNSKHYSGNAIDLRFNKGAYDYIKNDPSFSKYGLKVLDPNHGTAPHLHIQSKQYGGSTLYAQDDKTLKTGLNDSRYNEAYLKLGGTNTIRGLDNHQPVAVTDGSKYQVLYGPDDTAKFKGNVYEKRLK